MMLGVRTWVAMSTYSVCNDFSIYVRLSAPAQAPLTGAHTRGRCRCIYVSSCQQCAYRCQCRYLSGKSFAALRVALCFYAVSVHLQLSVWFKGPCLVGAWPAHGQGGLTIVVDLEGIAGSLFGITLQLCTCAFGCDLCTDLQLESL